MKIRMVIIFLVLIAAFSLISFAEVKTGLQYTTKAGLTVHVTGNLTNFYTAHQPPFNGYIVEFKEAPVLVKQAAIEKEIKDEDIFRFR